MSADRYARQRILPMVGAEGQERLLGSRVTVIGCGATGTVIANHLARAGVGHLRIVDRDWVEWNNLQRQLLYDESDVRNALPKATAAAARLSAVNSEILIEGVVADVNVGNIRDLIGDADLVMDGTDNLETRYLLNDACVEAGKPWVYCGAVGTYGMTMLVRPGKTACLRCVFPEPAPPGTTATCDTAGVLGPAVSVITSIGTTEGLKLLLGAEEALANGLIQVDVWDLSWHHLKLARQEDCPCCGLRQFPYLEASASTHATALCGRNAIQIAPTRAAKLSLPDLAARLAPLGEVTVNPFMLKFRTGEFLLTIFPDARAVIPGTIDEALARGLYARYVGA